MKKSLHLRAQGNGKNIHHCYVPRMEKRSLCEKSKFQYCTTMSNKNPKTRNFLKTGLKTMGLLKFPTKVNIKLISRDISTTHMIHGKTDS